MTKIVFTKLHLLKKGGLEKHSFKIIDAFLQKGYKITLLTTQISKNFNHPNLKIVLIKTLKILKLLKLMSFDLNCKKWIQKNAPNIVFSLDRSSYYNYVRLGIGLHTTYLNQKKLFENKLKLFFDKFNLTNKLLVNIEKEGFLQKNLKKIIVNSYMVKNELINNYNIEENKIAVIHNGFEFDETESDFNNWQIQKKINIKKFDLHENDFHFLFIGNDYKRKGLIFLLKALSLINDEKFHLLVIGKDKNIIKYIKLSKKLNLQDKVTFFNSRDGIINFYQIADSLVLPTFYDPFSNVALEALAFGLFVITSKYNGAKEIINSQNGKIVDIEDIKSFSFELKQTLNLKKTEKQANVIRQSVKHLTFEKQIDAISKTMNLKC